MNEIGVLLEFFDDIRDIIYIWIELLRYFEIEIFGNVLYLWNYEMNIVLLNRMIVCVYDILSDDLD